MNSGRQESAGSLTHLNRLTGLDDLTLSDTGVSDAGLLHLKDLGGPYTPYLDGTIVSDVGLVQLRGMSRLLKEKKVSGPR